MAHSLLCAEVSRKVDLRTACRYPVALVLAAALAFSVSPQPPKSAEIPLRPARAFGLMLVEARINGQPAVLILDTGSNHTIVSSKLVDVAMPALRNLVSSKKGSGYSGNGVGIIRFSPWTRQSFRKAWERASTACWAWIF